MVPPLFTSASRQKPQWVRHSRIQSAVTGAPDIPYFPMEVQAAAPGGSFTDDADLLAATGGSLHSNTQATSSLHHSNDIVDMIWILHYFFCLVNGFSYMRRLPLKVPLHLSELLRIGVHHLSDELVPLFVLCGLGFLHRYTSDRSSLPCGQTNDSQT